MSSTCEKKIHTLEVLQSAVLKTLLYFDIFHYPLNSQEINDNCQQLHITLTETETILNELVTNGLIKKQENFYFVNDDSSIVNRRKAGNKLANEALLIASRYSNLISKFPFVRGVYLSGSLSKGYMDKDSDIDYFIITAPSRLWLCRTLLVTFKKVVLLNSRKYFCVNYFIDTTNMEIPDKNLFTATELVSMHPTYNYQLYKQCMEENLWVKEFYPNKKVKEDLNVLPEKNFLFKSTMEKILNTSLGEKLDAWCFRITIKHWRKKFKNFDENQFDLHLRSRKNVSKHHPQGFQTKALNAHQQKIKDFENKYNIVLS
jgi:predicted nucleotidyltransferase